VFDIIVVIAFKSVFCLEMHQKIFLKKIIIFDIMILKQSKNTKKINFLKNIV